MSAEDFPDYSSQQVNTGSIFDSPSSQLDGPDRRPSKRLRERKRLRELQDQREKDPFYITDNYGDNDEEENDSDEVENIPQESISFDNEKIGLRPTPILSSKGKKHKLKVLKKVETVGGSGKKKKSEAAPVVNAYDDPLAYITLDDPLRDDEVVPVIKAYERTTAADISKKIKRNLNRKRSKKDEEKIQNQERKRSCIRQRR
eukprot:UN33170